eukprot:scaffold1004_cov269-Pinguiococcus_pyrenoidosus.AAC.10
MLHFLLHPSALARQEATQNLGELRAVEQAQVRQRRGYGNQQYVPVLELDHQLTTLGSILGVALRKHKSRLAGGALLHLKVLCRVSFGRIGIQRSRLESVLQLLHARLRLRLRFPGSLHDRSCVERHRRLLQVRSRDARLAIVGAVCQGELDQLPGGRAEHVGEKRPAAAAVFLRGCAAQP